MHTPVVKHTLDIFERMTDHLPPLLPKELVADIMHAREQMQNNHSLSVDDLEDTMIAFGKKIWPFRRAFDEFVDLHEGTLGEKFLLGKLSPDMKHRFKQFKEFGGSYRDLHTGAPATFFSPEERGILCQALIDVEQEIESYTRQAVTSTERRAYEDRVVEFSVILDDIEKRLDTLRLMAEDEQEHPDLAAEIRAQIRAFEQGLCLLAPRTDHAAVCRSVEHFEGRKVEKKAIRSRS